MIAHGTPANSSEFIKVFETNSLVPYLITSDLNYNISFNIINGIKHLIWPSQVNAMSSLQVRQHIVLLTFVAVALGLAPLAD
jgi:hypothetical protein